jgi:hypothetical protein
MSEPRLPSESEGPKRGQASATAPTEVQSDFVFDAHTRTIGVSTQTDMMKKRTNYQELMNRLSARIEEHEMAACKAGEVQFAGLFVQLRKTWIFYRYLVDRGTANEAPTGVRILYAKISNCLVSILHCLQQGYPSAAVMILRSLFEAHVHLAIILEKDTLERSKLFEDFIHVEREHTYSMVGATDDIRDNIKQP